MAQAQHDDDYASTLEQSEVSLAKAQTHDVATQLHQQMSLLQAEAQEETAKGSTALRAQEQELAGAPAKAEQLRLEVLQFNSALVPSLF